jgi:hypothetical protein
MAGFAANPWLRGEVFTPPKRFSIRRTPTVEKSPTNPRKNS